MQSLKDADGPSTAVSGSYSIDPETTERLRAFTALLLRWNAAINLVGRGDANLIWSRHVADSLRLLPLVPAGTPAATDLGSGAGFPGLVLAIATGIPFALVESDRRKAAFLQEAARVTGAPAAVYPVRIEAAPLAPAPLVTARALAPLPRLLELARPLLASGGICLLPKGAGAPAEIAEARRQGWDFTLTAHDDPASPDSTVLRLSDIHHA